MFPKALKSRPKSNKSPDLVTLPMIEDAKARHLTMSSSNMSALMKTSLHEKFVGYGLVILFRKAFMFKDTKEQVIHSLCVLHLIKILCRLSLGVSQVWNLRIFTILLTISRSRCQRSSVVYHFHALLGPNQTFRLE